MLEKVKTWGVESYLWLLEASNDQLMLVITGVYVVATIFISISNYSSAKATRLQSRLTVKQVAYMFSQLKEQKKQNTLLSEQLREQKRQFEKQLNAQIEESMRARQDWNTDKTTQNLQFKSAQKQQREIFEAQILEQRRIDSEKYRPQVDVTIDLDSNDNIGINFCNTGLRYAQNLIIALEWGEEDDIKSFQDLATAIASDEAFSRSFLALPEKINLGVEQSMYFSFGSLDQVKKLLDSDSKISTIISCKVEYQNIKEVDYKNSYIFDLKNYLGQTKLK